MKIGELILRSALVCVVYAVSFFLSWTLLQNIPGYPSLPYWVRLATSLSISLLVSAGVGCETMKSKQVALIVIVCTAATIPLVMTSGVPRQTIFGENPPENFHVPDGYAAFRFASGYTYVGSKTGEVIRNVTLELPWPYIDEYDEVGRPRPKPVGLDNWLKLNPLWILLVGTENNKEYMRRVWKLENMRSLGEIENKPNLENDYWLENAAWAVEAPLPGLPYTEVDFHEIHLALYAGNTVEWIDNKVKTLAGSRSSPPTITAHLPHWTHPTIFQKVVIELSEMHCGETVVIYGIFFVQREYENLLRLDDWVESGGWSATFKPGQENAPVITDRWNGGEISSSAYAQIEKYVDGKFVLLKRYEEEWENSPPGGSWGLIDGRILP